jgi:hypothetical protein
MQTVTQIVFARGRLWKHVQRVHIYMRKGSRSKHTGVVELSVDSLWHCLLGSVVPLLQKLWQVS